MRYTVHFPKDYLERLNNVISVKTWFKAYLEQTDQVSIESEKKKKTKHLTKETASLPLPKQNKNLCNCLFALVGR